MVIGLKIGGRISKRDSAPRFLYQERNYSNINEIYLNGDCGKISSKSLRMYKKIVVIAVLFAMFSLGIAQGQEANIPVANNKVSEDLKKDEPKYVGSFFDVQVTDANYFFISSVVDIFGIKGAPKPSTAEEREKYIWDQLLLSYEAFRRNVAVSQEEIDVEVRKILTEDKVTFDWKKDAQAYEKWVKERTNEPVILFENQLRHLVQVQKLNEQILTSLQPKVSEHEAFQEFLNEHNSLSVELVEFKNKKDALTFYAKVKSNLNFWDEEKNKKIKEFRRPGFVSLEFLMDIWKFSKKAVYQMMKQKIGAISQPFPIYKGYGVCKILETRLANASEFKKFKDSYYGQIRTRKKYEGVGVWFGNLKKQANIKIYSKDELSARKQQS